MADLAALVRRFTESALVGDSPLMPNTEFREWLEERRRAHAFKVTRIPFAELVGWRLEPETGDLRHVSGRFFAIQGLRVRTDTDCWSQPIINQPEIGILGIAVKEFGGILHCLMQAKMEPGHVNTVQLAPTVQATRSNYTKVHGGRSPHYIEWFTSPHDVLVDSLQSEHGAWFLRKRNRNMVVSVPGRVPEHRDFCWLTLGQILRLLQDDDIVNMDARTVLSCIPFAVPVRGGNSMPRSESGAYGPRWPTREILHWLTDLRTRRELVQQTIPCDAAERWHRSPDEIFHVERRYFTVRAVRVEATSREIGSWTQPLVQPVGLGVAALIIRDFGGVTKLLMHGRVEAGLIDVAELAPTVQCVPKNHRAQPPPYLEYVLAAPPDRIRYDVVQSEEGGRFDRARNRYLILEAGKDFDPRQPTDYIWITLHEAMELIERSYHVNVQARTLIAVLHGIWL
jgi:dTDP-4-dehydro-6-deoxy-alpha-D-glucopyranose 2,3-dehydratase